MDVFVAVLVFCVILCYNVATAESQWSLLRQSEYDVKLEIARVEFFNSSYFKYYKMEAVPYNRTYRVLNGSFEFNVNLNKQLVIGVETYKFLSNEYRFFPVTFEYDLCTEYNHDAFGLKQTFDNVSNIQPCYLKKDVHYRLVNAMPDFSKWPPHIPFGRYSLHINLIDKRNRNMVVEHVMNIEIKEKLKHWNP